MSGRQSLQVDALVGQFSSNQIEFLAEEELVTVVPNFTPRHSQWIRCLGVSHGGVASRCIRFWAVLLWSHRALDDDT